MNEAQLFTDLDHLSGLHIALEGFDSLPADAQSILDAFKGTSPAMESLTFTTQQVALESVGGKIKELGVSIVKWIKVQIMEFIAFIKSGKLEIGTVEKEVASTKGLLGQAKQYHTDEITLSPIVTGHLAINGVLDRTFADNMVRVRSVVELVLDMQPEAIKLSNKIADQLIKADTSKPDSFVGLENNFFDELAQFSAPYGKKLQAVDRTKTAVGPKRASNLVVSNSAGMKVQDMTSLPLPGGYALTGTLVSKVSGFSMGAASDHQERLERVVEGLIETMKPELVKVQSAGFTFKGSALTERDCKTVIDESEVLLSVLRKSFADESQIEAALHKIEKAASKATTGTGMLALNMKDQLKILRHLTKFVEMNKAKITRYSLNVIRAAVRYVRASVVPAEAVAPIDPNRGLAAPTAA